MRRVASFAMACAGAWVLAGCVGAGTRPAQRWFVLQAPAAAAMPASGPAGSAPRHAATLLLEPVTAAAFYDTQDIAYSKAAGVRAYYQYSSWTESPAQRLDALLAQGLERSGDFVAVAASSSGVRGRWVLRVHLDEVFHDAAQAPGVARVALTAELTEPARRALVGRRSFSASAPVATYDADGAVAGMSVALSKALDELTAWVGATARD